MVQKSRKAGKVRKSVSPEVGKYKKQLAFRLFRLPDFRTFPALLHFFVYNTYCANLHSVFCKEEDD
jgi:hypothetical protein